ncbi:uncharacterized protein LOC113273276 [Papaver somniferum]|uniref:uncharacterized protein LOC113273276 n=1 Tax=Papaver somniferum TaxID=3469 RepID=UPI000E702087|nr:uncharacterized protein LOC113273276 [Papaver somniferum]
MIKLIELLSANSSRDRSNNVDELEGPYNNSTPSVIDEEDDSLHLGFIPSIFINAKKDLYVDQSLPYEKVAKTDVIEFNRSGEFQIEKVQQFPEKAVHEFNRKNHIGLGKHSTIILSPSHSIFDPGKDFKLIRRFYYSAGVYKFGFDTITSYSLTLYACSILMDECDGNSVYELLPKNGYWSDSWSSALFGCISTRGDVFSTSWILLDKMPESEAWSSIIGEDCFLFRLQKLHMSCLIKC